MVSSKKNILFLLLAPFLICSVSFAERGNVGKERRGLAVGDRPTKAPVYSPSLEPTDEEKHTSGDDDDGGSGKGKGRPTSKSDDESGKGKGHPAPEGDDDDGSTGKGYIPDDDAFYMSYPEGKGKGARPSKSKKNSKKDSKSEKAGKSDKTGMFNMQVGESVPSVSK
jgi:hypothetical protein